ncbi:MAG: RES domain-containing protein [bacterium]|nr:RES domain-containing protein [bacterium]
MAVAAATGPSPSLPPLIILRLAKAGYASFAGEGARLYGGRWNHPGVRVVYASESLSLAALEYFVNLDTDLAPDGLVSVRVEIPGGIEQEVVEAGDLPRNWRTCPAPEALQDLGTEWIQRGETGVLSVPSAVVPEERNYLLNPAHGELSRILIGRPRPFHFDPRMWK